jgi:predicted metal-dependent HD superfamily phosphohydrolase
MSDQNKLLRKADAYVQQEILENLPNAYLFHNYEHTEEVVEAAKKLADSANLSEDNRIILLLAAVFHDLGYVKGHKDHEKSSAQMAEEFLKEQQMEPKTIEEVKKLILSTRKSVTPETELEKILHDACWSFLGRKRFFRRAQLLEMEYEQVHQKKISKKKWNRKMLDVQLETSFLTPYGLEEYGSRKNKNTVKQQQELADSRKKSIRKKTGKNFGRGIDTLYRVTLRNHINLSSIADGKANMIISINTLVLSILITAGTAGLSIESLSLANNLDLVIPIFLLMLSSLTAIVFAVLSAIPKVSGAPLEFESGGVDPRKVNLLFFGNFLRLDKEDYVAHLRELKKDQELLYDDLARDLYNLGVVLQKKYRLLTVAYRVFIGGLVVSVMAFLIMTILM